MKNKALKAFSLVELLVVIAIIAIIAAILVPVIVRSRVSGYHARNITEFRQLAVAQSIYTQDYGAMAFGVPTLVSAGLVPKDLAADPLDPWPNGVVNYDLGIGGNNTATAALRVNYKLSFYGWREWGRSATMYEMCIANQPEAGWLIDPNFWPGRFPNQYNIMSSLNRYMRLENDGSVRMKYAIWLGDCDLAHLGEKKPCHTAPNTYFADGNAQWVQKVDSFLGGKCE